MADTNRARTEKDQYKTAASLLRMMNSPNEHEAANALVLFKNCLQGIGKSLEDMARNIEPLLNGDGALRDRLDRFVQANSQMAEQNAALREENGRLRQKLEAKTARAAAWSGAKEFFEPLYRRASETLAIVTCAVGGPVALAGWHLRYVLKGRDGEQWEEEIFNEFGGLGGYMVTTMFASLTWGSALLADDIMLDSRRDNAITSAVEISACKTDIFKGGTDVDCPVIAVPPSVSGIFGRHSDPLRVTVRSQRREEAAMNEKGQSGRLVCQDFVVTAKSAYTEESLVGWFGKHIDPSCRFNPSP